MTPFKQKEPRKSWTPKTKKLIKDIGKACIDGVIIGTASYLIVKLDKKRRKKANIKDLTEEEEHYICESILVGALIGRSLQY